MPTTDQARAAGTIRGAQRQAAHDHRLARLRALLDAGGDRSLPALRAALGLQSDGQLRKDLRELGEPPRKPGRKPASRAAAKES